MRSSPTPSAHEHPGVARLIIVVASMTLGCDQTAVSPEQMSPLPAGGVSLARDAGFSDWSPPIRVDLIPGNHPNFNSASNDGCPFISRDGKTFYMASNRDPRGLLDIWVSTRESETDGWGEPANVTSINTATDDFCPTISRDGHLLYFASRRAGGCGGSDLYVARRRADNGFDPAELLPCDDTPPYDAVNSPLDEWGPFDLPERGAGPVLYFSSFRPGGFAAEPAGGAVDSDIYRSESHGGVFGEAELVSGLNTAADDGQPNVRRDGLEIFFYSTRVIAGVSQGAADLYVSTRPHIDAPWSEPANLGKPVNDAGGDSRPSLSWDGTTLYFGSVRAGGKGAGDIWVTTRARLGGPDR